MSIKMKIHVNLVLWCVLIITAQCLTKKECVQRRLGACKTLIKDSYIALDELQSPPLDGFLLKTSIEINLLENKHTFENNLPVEKKRPVSYNLDNAALVKISIGTDVGYISINLGKKYYRLAKLTYYNYETKITEIKYSRYTPILPTFPYNLHLELTTNGTFSVFADGNNEPFFEYQVKPSYVNRICFDAEGNNNDLIAFVDCSLKYQPHCGSHRSEKLYGCREWVVGDYGRIKNFDGFQKTYGKDVPFDEFIVVDTGYYSRLIFYFKDFKYSLSIGKEGVNSIRATLKRIYPTVVVSKGVRTEQWLEVPESPYAVRLLLTTGENNNFLKITNLRNNTIISMNLCKDMGRLEELDSDGPKLYFDCVTSDDDLIINDRPRKTNETDVEALEYHKNGYNYTKTFIDTSKFVSKPFIMYQYDFGNSTRDWCPDEPRPEDLVTSKYDDDSLEDVIQRSNTAFLSELKKINAQNNATADTIAALLTELKNVSADTNAAVLKELKVISDSLATHLEQNITTINNYNYYNNINVTEFLKFLKQK